MLDTMTGSGSALGHCTAWRRHTLPGKSAAVTMTCGVACFLLKNIMTKILRLALAWAGLAMGGHAAAQVTFYEREDYRGRSFTTEGAVENFQRHGFNDSASSVVVQGNRWERWEVCEDRRFRGHCVVLRPGQYSTLAAMGLNDGILSVRAVDRRDGPVPPPPQAPSPVASQIDFYANEGFQGTSFTADQPVPDLRRSGFNDRASSAVVTGGRWEVCQNVGFGGPCTVLRPGQYPSLAALGLNDRISSVRAVGRNGGDEDGGPTPPPPPAESRVVFFENEGFQGRAFTADAAIDDLRRFGFNDRASSVEVQGNRWERWEVCEDRRFRGHCVVLRPGQYSSLAAMGLNDGILSARAVDRRDGPVPPPPQAPPPADSRVVFFENEGFQGRAFTADAAIDDFRRFGFNDRASSAVVSGGRWEACQDTRFGGPCVVLRPGQYPSLAAMGLNDGISSVRAVGHGATVDDRRYAPLPMVSRDYGRRNEERLYDANITSVRAVVEDSGQRCWVEPQQVVQERSSSNPNVPGALLGAVIGGILGHQVGGGSGKDVATGIGVVAGAAIGANSGRGDGSQQVVTTQNVQRCTSNPGQARPAYWDVTYSFRGQEYRVQMNKPPGRTVTVNEQGEPRG